MTSEKKSRYHNLGKSLTTLDSGCTQLAHVFGKAARWVFILCTEILKDMGPENLRIFSSKE